MSKVILTDSCFWIGLLDSSDQFHEAASSLAELIQPHKILLPWPCLYEILSTRLARKRERILHFEELIRKPNIELLDDSGYRLEAFDQLLSFNKNVGFTFSLADSVIREMIKDVNIKVSYFETFNSKDFLDVCHQRRIEILDHQ